ncbi:hypothetical protein DVH24_030037, partial [Malus domestica]
SRSDLCCSKTSDFVHQHLAQSVGNDTKNYVGSLSFFHHHRESEKSAKDPDQSSYSVFLSFSREHFLSLSNFVEHLGCNTTKPTKANKAIVLTFAEKCKSLLSSNWQGQLNAIKPDAKGSKEDIYTSKVKYICKRGKPYLWVPEKELHNVEKDKTQASTATAAISRRATWTPSKSSSTPAPMPISLTSTATPPFMSPLARAKPTLSSSCSKEAPSTPLADAIYYKNDDVIKLLEDYSSKLLKSTPRASYEGEGVSSELIEDSKFVHLNADEMIFSPPALLLLGFEVEEVEKIQQFLKQLDEEFLKCKGSH